MMNIAPAAHAPLTVESPRLKRQRAISEGLILGICGLAPWLFGAVDAWAELVIGFVIVIVTLVGIVGAIKDHRVSLSMTSLAIAGLLLFGIIQQFSIPGVGPYYSTFNASGESIALTPAVGEQLIASTLPLVNPAKESISINPEATRLGVARLAGAWLLFEAVMRLDSPYSTFRRFGVMTVVNSCLLSLYSLVQWLTWNGKIYWFRPSPRPELAWYAGGPFICHNHLAAYLNIGFGFSIGLLLASLKGDPWFRGSRGQRFWPALIAGLVLLGLLVSHSRGGLIAAITSIIIMFTTQRLRLGWSLLAFAFLMLSAFLVLIATGSASPWTRLSTVSNPYEDARWDVWRVSIKAWSQRPLFGYGLGTFGSAVTPFTDTDVQATYQRAENQYIDLLVEEGIVGLSLGLSAIGFTIYSARRAIRGSRVLYERVFIAGGFFGGVGLLLHWMTDFSFHIPAVAISVIVLAGLLCRLGIDHGARWLVAYRSRPLNLLVSAVLPVMLCAMILIPAIRNTKVEVALWRVGLPLPDTLAPTLEVPSHTPGTLRDQIKALDFALKLRPDWSEGHLRRGLAYLELYQVTASLWIKESRPDLGKMQLSMMSDPLWLRLQVTEGRKINKFSPESLLEQDPVRDFLIPAAGAFLEARRCCRFSALADLELANLHYLLKNGDSSSRYIQRALALAGSNPMVLLLCGALSSQDGDLKTTARCWRRALEVNPNTWKTIAIAAGPTLTPEVILSTVIPPDQGRLLLLFATEVDNQTENSREFLLKAALERIPHDVTLDPAEVKHGLAMAHDGLGQREEAVKMLTDALALDPKQLGWRILLISWLVEKEAWEEARTQANIGLDFDPSNSSLEYWRNAIIERIARGDPPPIRIFQP